ncbi:FecR family protein [Mariniphaga sediminis]|uniref:FecR family protein n=1 Tax=Mariniphaga sediminis TaxID=1628158 RepID=UPI00356707A6
MNHKTDIEQLVIRYLNGECSITDQQELKHWLSQSDENQKIFYRIKDVWDASLKKEDNTREALLQFYKQRALQKQTSTKVLRLWKVVAGIAAVFVIGLVSVFILNMLSGETPNVRSEAAMMSFKVPFGSRSEVNLPDGTTVILNSGSELEYPVTFVDGKREVSLNGEAFFNVMSDEANPFIVKTNYFDVQVTGTQFNVCSYTDDNFSNVSLLEGHVGVLFEQKEKVVDIVPGQQFYLDKEKRIYRISERDVDMESSWKDGEFRFKEIAFPDLMKRLERWYDVRLSYSAPELEEMLYSGNFRNHETIWQVLDGLKLTTPIDYKRLGFRKFEIIYKPM